ncbi:MULTISPECIES: hypothetical protein [Haloferax]|uniref:Uncharacterized protein n=1 Tax=Haloferax marinum TaxID=2666143 RepID=A0A6A8G5A9_9EURY|nr:MULTISPECIES: hypothetical protein [Haloferax]KAB1197163.1 hypothetical protein Hfx1150_06385 [Haloferax sp. CBA1150]MRW96199.1 hypothetical protein [Haloferax marinum]
MRDGAPSPRAYSDSRSRGQLSLTVVEAVVATLFVLAVAASFSLLPTPTTTLSLDQQAADAASLVAEAPSDGPGTILGAACSSAGNFDARSGQLHTTASMGLPDGAFVSIRTSLGSAGRPPPESARTGSARAVVPECTATIEVWYP